MMLLLCAMQVRERLTQHKEKKYESEQIDFVPDGERPSFCSSDMYRNIDVA